MPNREPSNTYAPLPSTLKRSSTKAQGTYEETLQHAEQEYHGDEARSHRAAWGAVKHSFEKIGDHWEAKAKKGPSDPRAAQGGPRVAGKTYGGVDVTKPKAELLHEAQQFGLNVTSHDTKDQIAEMIQGENTRQNRQRREHIK